MIHLKRELRQIFYFLVVGAISTLFNYLVFWVCLDVFRVFYLISNWVGYFAGVFLGFYLNARFTFYAGRPISKRHPVLYAGVYLLSWILSSITLYLLVDFLGIQPKISNIFAIAQSTTTNYLGCRFIVFRVNHENRSGQT